MPGYIALSAKVRALYGGRMTAEDYRQLMAKRTLPEAVAFLQGHRGYAAALAGITPSGIHREALEIALRRSYVAEYQRIFRFLSLEDKELLRFPIYRAEQEAILTAMRRLSSQHILQPEAVWSETLKRKSRLRVGQLSIASSFREIVCAAQDTIYASALERSAVEGETPSPAFVDNMMRIAYYARLYKLVSARYAGQTRQILRQSLDSETDLLNLVQFLRLKRHFSQEDVQRYSFSLPCSHKLSKSYVQQLLAAPDYEEALALVREGPYASLFQSISPTGLEAYLYELQFRFNQRQLRGAVPTIYTPIAYLTLKEIELRNIISIIECIRYQISPETYVTLIGV